MIANAHQRDDVFADCMPGHTDGQQILAVCSKHRLHLTVKACKLIRTGQHVGLPYISVVFSLVVKGEAFSGPLAFIIATALPNAVHIPPVGLCLWVL